ncbi:hypothetical protein EVJ58_g9509 [Rhodofomes roseus]|uniref:GTPase activating protein n=1 Tax=Rhodofomes roseus TaxID=34475 RepID=A0A4Y9XU88_9APHY|nr:hypothetical protein EVJ58_g9509 [Rhodofomes roseus]
MFFYLSFLRPPPSQALPSDSVSITPQVANDLRTELLGNAQDIYYAWCLPPPPHAKPGQLPAITKPQKLTTWRQGSAYKELSVPTPPGIREGQSCCLVLTTHAQGYPHLINLGSTDVGQRPYPVMSMPILFCSKNSKGKSPAYSEKQEHVERIYRIPLNSSEQVFMRVKEQTSFDLDKKVWDSGIGLSSWITTLANDDSIASSAGILARMKSAILSPERRSIIELGKSNDLLAVLVSHAFINSMADVTYNTSAFPSLIRTVSDILRLRSPSTPELRKTVLLLGYKERDPAERTLWEMMRDIGQCGRLYSELTASPATGAGPSSPSPTMSEGRYSPSSWDHADGSETNHSANHSYEPGPPVESRESLDVNGAEAASFFKKRALLEEEYGRGMQRLAKATSDAYSSSEGKAGTFVTAWHSALRVHEQMADNRLRLSQRLNEMSQELSTLAKEVDFSRKQTKELASRYEKTLQESEATTEKCKVRVDVTAEELERLLLQKEGESMKDSQLQGRTPGGASGKRVIGKAVAKGGMLLKGRNPGNLQRQEEDIRARMSKESDAYRKAVTETQAIRQEYFNFQYPRLLRVRTTSTRSAEVYSPVMQALKECVDEIDLGTQYHLSRYAFLCESVVLSDGTTLTPVDDSATLPGLKTALESIDNRSDFKTYMQNYAFAHGGANSRGPRRDGPREEGFMARDDVDVPSIMVKCCEAIEKYGLKSQGVYRIGGTMTKVAKLKERLDRDLDSVNLDAEEWSSDISNVTSVLKMWLRELPDPLLTIHLHGAFLEASRNDNERLRHIRLHERVNDLPDPNYSTLKYFMGHLHKIVEHEAENAMSVQNLAIVFGPTLFGQMLPGMNGQLNGMADAGLQNKSLTGAFSLLPHFARRAFTQAIETILEHYTDIFVDDNEA